MIILLAGPSSVGKTTYAKKKYKNYPIIDSDDVWFELAIKYNWDKKLINKNLFETIAQRALEYPNTVIVHTDPQPIVNLLKKDYKIILLATNFRNLARNLIKRNDRPVSVVLGNSPQGFLYYFTVTNKLEKPNLFLRKKDLDLMPVKTKKDKKSVDIIKNKLFKDKNTVRVVPKINYDEFIHPS